MEGTRLRILQLLQKRNRDNVDGLASAIGLAPATIRRHLDILQRDRLVAFEEVRKKTGRPEYSFYLTESGQEALPKGYDRLLGMMVQELSGLSVEDTATRDGQQILGLVFRRMSDRVARHYTGELFGRKLGERLETLLGRLSDDDFVPEAEVADGMVRIRLLNCPFRSVAMQTKAVCTFDINLISSLLDLDASQAECIHDGDSSCMYVAPVAGPGEKVLTASNAG